VNNNPNNLSLQDCSSTQVEIQIEESWIDKFLTEKNLSIPINEQNTLENLRVNIGEGILNFKADLKEKENTSIEVTSRPEWDAASQRITINDLKLKTDTQNILLKSAGWIAQTFLQGKIDKKLEEQANQMFRNQLQKLREKPLEFPIPKGGNVIVRVSSITIQELSFIEHAIRVKVTIESYPKVQLT
jgi:hypothetical protein